MKYQNKQVIITGGSSGIGKATAILLAQQGANLALIARDRQNLQAAKSEIEALKLIPNQKIIIFKADVANFNEITTIIQMAISELGGLDLLITSAGIAHPGYFSELSIEIFERTMAVNYFGSLYSIQAALPTLIAQKQGQIVLISSGAGSIGIYGYTAYSSSKFAVRGLAESLRGELKPKGIRVSIVYPPDTDTPQLAQENKTKPPETKAITATAATWTAEAVAQTILTGIERRQIEITPGLEMTVLNRWHSLLKPLLNWYFDKIITKVMKTNGSK
jgi:3-dehydrosphinganine reductase